MHALQIVSPGKVEIIELPMPVPDSEEVLIEIEAVTTCPHWDQHIFEGRPMFAGMEMKYPYWPGQPGHEAIGKVVGIGESVSGELMDQRVAVWRDSGPNRMGMYASHGIVPVENIMPIPPDLPAEKITSLELAMCVQVSIDQLQEINAIRDHRVVVSGLGPAGLIAVQLLRRAGAAQVWAVDPIAQRRDLALKLGADHAIMPQDSTLPGSRDSASAFYAGLDTTGLPKAIEPLMNSCKRAVAIFGVLRNPVPFGWNQWYGGFSLIGYGVHNREAASRALGAILDDELDLAPLVSETLPLSAYAGAVEKLKSLEAIKILFTPEN